MEPVQSDSQVVRSFEEKKPMKNAAILITVLLLLGIGTGYVAAYFAPVGNHTNSATTVSDTSSGTSAKVGQTIGSNDKSFTDTAQGVLKKGGIDGEGAYHLERPGGASQNVYMTSSVLDLSNYQGRTIKVWGKTYQGNKAGWLMDVGRIQVLK